CRERDHALFDFRLLQRDLRYGLSAHLGAIQPFSSLRIDVLLLTLLLTSHEVGLYVAASAGSALIRTQGTALGMVLMPEVAKRVDRKGRYSVIGRFGALGLLLGGLTAAVAVIWAEPLIVLVYGEAFAEGATALRFLVMGAVLASLHRMFADALRGMVKPLAGTAAEVTSLVIGVPAILVLTRLAGLNGGAAAAALASLGGFAIGLWALLRALHGSRQPVETSTLTRAG